MWCKIHYKLIIQKTPCVVYGLLRCLFRHCELELELDLVRTVSVLQCTGCSLSATCLLLTAYYEIVSFSPGHSARAMAQAPTGSVSECLKVNVERHHIDTRLTP